MRLHREDIGPVEQILVGVGVVASDALDQLVLPDDGRRGVAAGSRGRTAGGGGFGLHHQLRGVPHGSLRALPAIRPAAQSSAPRR